MILTNFSPEYTFFSIFGLGEAVKAIFMTAKKRTSNKIIHSADRVGVDPEHYTMNEKDDELGMLRSLAEFNPDMVSIHLSDGSFSFVSSACRQILGYEPGELLGNNPYHFIHEEDRDRVIQNHQLLIDGNPVNEPVKYRFKRKDETYCDIESVLNLFSDPKGSKMIVASSRKVIPQAVTSSKKTVYQEVFRNADDGIAILDSNALYLEQNKSHLDLLGYPDEELLGKSPDHFLGKELFREIFKVLTFQGVFTGEFQVSTRAQNKIYVDISFSLLPVSENKERIVCVVRDISERKEAEKKAMEAIRKAEEADMMKSAFLSNMSHEIRTPMNAIVGFSNLLLSSSLEEEKREKYVQFINKNGENLLHLIDDIIDISKIESDQIKIEISTCNLSELMEEVYASILEVKAREGKDYLGLKQKFPDSDFFIRTDCYRLRQVLLNLLNNAVKYTLSGHIEFGFRLEQKNKLLFFVKDTGPGIPGNLKELIFERFRRIESQSTKLMKGAGLGLAISRQLVNLLGGKIWVESEPGLGSVFYFTIPYLSGHKSDIETQKSFTGKASLLPWSQNTILVAEDDYFSFELIHEYLCKSGIKIVHATTGEEAVKAALTGPGIDIVLMDIRMPVLNGYEATRQIKKIRPELPVIAQSAYTMDEDRKNALSAGCDEFLSKPVDRELFFNALRKYLG